MLRHVIDNALKFSPVDSPVTVRVRPTGDGVEIRVRDHGPGISPDYLGRAFDPFTQADSSTTREHGGLGIGLFVTRQLIHALGGRVKLTRHAKVGTVALPHIPDLILERGQTVRVDHL